MKKSVVQFFARNALAVAVASTAVGIGFVAPLAQANQQTSAIVGKVYDQQGDLARGASVTVTDLRTGTTRTVKSNDNGAFSVRNLSVGGPYEVKVNGVKQTTVQSISLGDAYSLDLQIGGAMEEIVVLGKEMLLSVAPGPSANFGQAELETAVAFERDIKDVFAMDPRLNVGGDSGAVNCVGKSPRFNTTTLDGVRYSDQFGLNSNGYGTATGMPFPFDAVEQVAVEIAPFDVRYGGFSACNINAVTKRGTNEWHGNVFYEYTDQDLRGDEVAGTQFDLEPYEEKFYGFSAQGPIIEDTLFVSFAYEKQEFPQFNAQGFNGSGNGQERAWLDEATFNRVRDIAQNVYNYDAGGQPGDGAQEAEKYFARVDWNINDQHSAAFVYNYYEGFQNRASDSDRNEFEFANHFYTKSDENTTYSFFLSSQWNDNFSTEIFAGYQEQIDGQVTVGPKDFGDHQISDVARNTIYLGADDSRQANGLSYEADYLRLNAEYLWGDHSISFGYHRETLDVFNMFVQHSNGGEWDYFDDSAGNPEFCSSLTAQERFESADCGLSGLDRFELGRPSRIYYGSAGGTNDPTDAAAQFENTLNAVFIQDDFTIDEYSLTITAGLRYEWWDSKGRPRYNAAFEELNGFRNDATIDGTDLLMPRIGITWDAQDNLTVRGGLGLYSGGNPNVWLSNSYSNDGISNAQFVLNNFDGAFTVLPGSADSVDLSRQGRPGYDVPQSLVDRVSAVSDADASTTFLALVDPDYEQPAEWKASIGATYEFANGYVFDADYLYTRGQDPAYYVDVSQDVVGRTSLGLPIYDYARGEDNYMLTNSNQNPEAHVLSLTLRKYFDNGIDILAGYAYTDAEDVSPMTSSVAQSNFSNLALNDLVEPGAATSNYVVPHRFTLRVGYRAKLFGDNETRISLYSFAQEGQPGSFVMGSGDQEGDGFFGRHLLYVPTGIDDPNVVIADSFDYSAFEAWRREQGVGTGLTKRNDYNARWTYRVDLRVDQEFPIFNDVKGLAYLKIYNLTNLLNDEWGVVNDAQFFSVQAVDSSIDDQGRYVFESFNGGTINNRREERSLWEIRMGVSISF
jgi:hypothetical protein